MEIGDILVDILNVSGLDYASKRALKMVNKYYYSKISVAYIHPFDHSWTKYYNSNCTHKHCRSRHHVQSVLRDLIEHSFNLDHDRDAVCKIYTNHVLANIHRTHSRSLSLGKIIKNNYKCLELVMDNPSLYWWLVSLRLFPTNKEMLAYDSATSDLSKAIFNWCHVAQYSDSDICAPFADTIAYQHILWCYNTDKDMLCSSGEAMVYLPISAYSIFPDYMYSRYCHFAFIKGVSSIFTDDEPRRDILQHIWEMSCYELKTLISLEYCGTELKYILEYADMCIDRDTSDDSYSW